MMRFVALACVLVFGVGTPTGAAGAYLAELQQRADALELHGHPYWHKLLHYEQRSPGSFVSAAEDPAFFLAASGRRDPRAELHATLRGFFEPAPAEGQHPQCRFVARYHWLREQLSFDPERLPTRPCPEFEAWYETIEPHRLTLIFASAYLNNPASMFGHTLLRIDPPRARPGEELVSYALNYAAQTNETSGIVFAYRGIFGGYLGTFSLMPYYDKVQEYNDLESRDLWEYELDFDQREVDRVMRHAWELDDTGFRYYFFLENCSYRLLELLELAREDLELTDRFRIWAIPSDTVRVVLEQEGLLADVRFRAGKVTVIRAYVRQLRPPARELAHQVAWGELAPDAQALLERPAAQRAAILEVAHEYLHYRLVEGAAPDQHVRRRLHELLLARSRVPTASGLRGPTAPAARPDEGHATARLAAGGGTLEGESYAALRWRPAYHELLDPGDGYQPGAQINFFDIELRAWPEAGALELEHLHLVNIESLSPRDRFFRPSSWHVHVGLGRQELPDGRRVSVGELAGGSTLSYAVGRGLFHAGWMARAQWGSALPGDGLLGFGPRLGWLGRFGGFGSTRVAARALWHYEEDEVITQAFVEHRVPISGAWALGLRLERREAFDRSVDEAHLALHLYH